MKQVSEHGDSAQHIMSLLVSPFSLLSQFSSTGSVNLLEKNVWTSLESTF